MQLGSDVGTSEARLSSNPWSHLMLPKFSDVISPKEGMNAHFI